MTSSNLEIEKPDSVPFHLISSFRWTKFNSTDVDQAKTSSKTDLEQQLLPLHRDRLLAAAEAFKWNHVTSFLASSNSTSILETEIITYLASLPEPERDFAHVYKLRIMLLEDGDIRLDGSMIHEDRFTRMVGETWIPKSLEPASGASMPVCKVYIDSEPTSNSVYTTHKTSSRHLYDLARERGAVSRCGPMQADVLLWNQDVEIMEASMSTPYFFRDRRWITPSQSCGGNTGVTRRKALEDGLCQEAVIKVGSLKHGEVIWLSNAVRGFFLAQIVLRKD